MDQTLPRRVLVTGLSGFVGAHILQMREQILREYNAEILTTAQQFDLRNQVEVARFVADTNPDDVIHLAGQSNIPAAFKDPEQTLQINVIGTLHLLQALDQHGFHGRLLYVSSGDVYGAVNVASLPMSEKQLPRPGNPYAVSKLAAEALCLQWSVKSDYDILVARPFNHIGPGQSADFVVPSIAKQIAESHSPVQVSVGDIDVTRDFLDVRDVIHAYFSLLKKGKSGHIYNVCSGKERRIRDLALEIAALSGKQVSFVEDPTRIRPIDHRRVCGASTLIMQDTGWTPRFGLEQTLQDILQSFQHRTIH